MFETPQQQWEVLGYWSVDTNFGPLIRGMKITARTDHQAELTRQDRQHTDLISRLQAIDHLNGMAARLDEFGHQATAFAASEVVIEGMRHADPGTRAAQCRHGVFKGWPVQLDITEFAGAQPLAKRLGAVLDMAGLNQEVSKMRPRRGVAAIP